jgi:hypothetical protein
VVNPCAEPLATGLDDRFLADPQGEERLGAIGFRQASKVAHLGRGEEVLGDAAVVDARPDPLDVDAHVAAAGDRDQGDACRAGGAEAQVAGACQVRLAEIGDREPHPLGVDAQVPADDHPQPPSGGQEAAPLEAITHPLGTLHLVDEGVGPRRAGVEVDAPDVDARMGRWRRWRLGQGDARHHRLHDGSVPAAPRADPEAHEGADEDGRRDDEAFRLVAPAMPRRSEELALDRVGVDEGAKGEGAGHGVVGVGVGEDAVDLAAALAEPLERRQPLGQLVLSVAPRP